MNTVRYHFVDVLNGEETFMQRTFKRRWVAHLAAWLHNTFAHNPLGRHITWAEVLP